jgi:sulfur carrier protein
MISLFIDTLIMEIELNGEKMQVPTEISAAGLIDHLKLADKRLALEVNQEIVPRSQYAEVMIKDNDTVEIVHAIGGG